MTAFVDKTEKIIFIHVPKTGGTSISKSWDKKNKDIDYAAPHGTLGGYQGHVSLSICQMHITNYDEYFSFAVMREPCEWLVSLYEYRLFRFEKQAIRSFSAFIDNFYNSPIPHNEHLQSYWFTLDGEIGVDKVLNFSNLNEEFKKTFPKLGDLPILNKGKKKKIEINHSDYYNRRNAQKATKLLEPDIKIYDELFGENRQP